MRLFPPCLNAFLRRLVSVEVYVTKGPEDVQCLPESKDLSEYTCLAILSEDSTIVEMVQAALLNHGKWPHAPILHLPGGSSNVIANELFPVGASTDEIIIAGYSAVKMGAVLKASGSNGASIFALQIFAADLCRSMIVLMRLIVAIHVMTIELGVTTVESVHDSKSERTSLLNDTIVRVKL
jgi:hypothetical protein